MQIFQIFKKENVQNVFELKELGKQDGESQLDQLTSQAQAQIQHFEKVCNDINEKITHYGSSKGMDDIQKSVKEAQNDLHQMEIIIQNMGSIQISKNTENQKKQQTLQKLIKIVQNSKENLKLITYQLAQKHQTSQIQAKQPAKGRHGDNQINIQLLEEDFDYGYDELYIQSRNQQIMEIAQVINQINEMMQEAAKMIKEQGEQIKIIRINIKDAKTKTDGAAEETKKAAQASKGNNDRTLYFCGIITLLVVIIVLMYSAGSRTYPDTDQQQSQN
ncbi:unnamed protein product [Paramecium octaurelia]|uniref:t-SNARE coiled-coil homology domain-containing protein n=1 Tax=Paramecium octaurelia TaxID=43137 RepID=A0A8S1U7E1_PAROT|nr:unnamed protein product [Paramecium octaurelia]